MSGDWDDCPAEVWDERVVVARKAHVCSGCDRTIPPGAQYVRHVRINRAGDRPEVWKRCAPCEVVYRHLCEIAPDYESAPLPDLSCGHSYEDVHGRRPPPEVEAMVFALPSEVKLGGAR